MNKSKFRHELKYEIPYGEYLILYQRLRHIMSPDPNSPDGSGTYQICSVYFDDIFDTALREKLDGIRLRHKYRIRFYNGNDSYMALEKKSKTDSLCQKESCRISRDEADALIHGNTDRLECIDRPLLAELCSLCKNGTLSAKTVVSYTRTALIYPAGNVRITFDSDICTGMYCSDPFSRLYTPFRTLPLSHVILEVKFDEYLPDTVQCLLQNENARLGAYSKYAACRSFE